MKPLPILLTLICFTSATHIRAAAKEILVDAGGNGAPYRTISEAVKVAPDGGTITVKAGVYRETVSIQNKKNTEPLIIRAAQGERVIVTSFDPLEGWKDEGNGLYSLVKPDRVNDLYVAGMHQRSARFPDSQSPYTAVTQIDPATGSVQLDQFPKLQPGEEKSLCLFILNLNGNLDCFYRAKSVDPATKTFTFQGAKPSMPKVGDAALFFNAPSFIKYPGEWACLQTGEHEWKLFFRPKTPDDLKKTETRAIARSVVFDIANAANVTLEGLEVSGGGHRGIDVQQCDQLHINHCLIYDNGVGGINLDTCTNVTVDSCIVFANRHGILVNSGENFTLQGSEIAWNEEDGVDMAGRGLQDPNAPPFKNAVLRNNYIHGHIYLGHPDNTQSWGNVDGLTYENNLMMLGGNSNGGQLEDCENLKVDHNACLGSANYQYNLGIARGLHTAVYNASFTNNIFAWGAGACITMAQGLHDISVFRNVIIQNYLSYGTAGKVTSGDNLFNSRGLKDDRLIVSKLGPRVDTFGKVEDFRAGQKNLEINSRTADPGFKNAPVCLLRGTGFLTPPNAVMIVKDPGKTFAVGDNIEVNGDGVPRKITAVDGQKITFAPPLASTPFRDLVIWNWGPKTNFQIDVSSTVVGGKNQPGCYLDVAAYQRGELDGSGKRTLPPLTPELRALMPVPSDFVFPYYLYLQGRFD